MPDPRLTEEELLLQARKSCWRRATEEYIRENCDEAGNQLESNLSPALTRGIKKLRRRIKEREIVVMESDKGWVITASSYESYLRQGKVHTANDEIIDMEGV